MNFQVNDRVRLIPNTYHDFFKSTFNNPVNCSELEANDTELKLGAEYIVSSINTGSDGQQYLRLKSDNNDRISNPVHACLVSKCPIDTCPFNEDDVVSIKKLPKGDEAYFVNTFQLKEQEIYSRSFKIKRVLNDYYVFLEEPILGVEYKLPVKWVDLSKI